MPPRTKLDDAPSFLAFDDVLAEMGQPPARPRALKRAARSARLNESCSNLCKSLGLDQSDDDFAGYAIMPADLPPRSNPSAAACNSTSLRTDRPQPASWCFLDARRGRP